jgi:hypothetical protein
VNRKGRNGRNLFEGGFLGLDNIGVFDRSLPLPTGGYLEQADGTAIRLKVRSMVGLLPLCAATVIERWQRERVPGLTAEAFVLLRRTPERVARMILPG